MNTTPLSLLNGLLDTSLHTLKMGQEGNLVVDNTYIDALLIVLNEGLVTTYAKFNLGIVNGYITLVKGTLTYDLSLLDGFGKLIAVRYEEQPLPLDSSTGIRMISGHLLYVPETYERSLGIEYRKQPVEITKRNIDTLLDLPDLVFKALGYYVTHKMLMMNASDSSRAMAKDYLSLYESTCNDILASDAVNMSDVWANSKFTRNGWV